jgi:hypothetical protein
MVMREMVKNHCKQRPTAANKLPAEFSKDMKGLSSQQSTHTVHLKHLRKREYPRYTLGILHTDASVLVLECKAQWSVRNGAADLTTY